MSEMKNKVLLVDDDQLLLEGLSLSLRKEPYQLYTSTSVDEAISIMEARNIDVVVADLCFDGACGSGFLSRCYSSWPKAARIILSGHVDPNFALEAINDFRAFKFLTKPCSPPLLKAAITDALAESELEQGKDELVDIAIKQLLGHNSSSDIDVRTERNALSSEIVCDLTPREIQLLELLVNGWRLNKISQELNISQHTARNHLKSIFNKLNVHSQQELLDLVITPKV